MFLYYVLDTKQDGSSGNTTNLYLTCDTSCPDWGPCGFPQSLMQMPGRNFMLPVM